MVSPCLRQPQARTILWVINMGVNIFASGLWATSSWFDVVGVIESTSWQLICFYQIWQWNHFCTVQNFYFSRKKPGKKKNSKKIDPNTNYGQLITWTWIAVSSTNSLKRWMLNHVITRSLGFDPHLRCLNFSAPPFRSQRLLYFDGWVGNGLIDTCMFLDSEKRWNNVVLLAQVCQAATSRLTVSPTVTGRNASILLTFFYPRRRFLFNRHNFFPKTVTYKN